MPPEAWCLVYRGKHVMPRCNVIRFKLSLGTFVIDVTQNIVMPPCNAPGLKIMLPSTEDHASRGMTHCVMCRHDISWVDYMEAWQHAYGDMTSCLWRHDIMPLEAWSLLWSWMYYTLHLGMTENWRHDLCVWRHDLSVEAGGMTFCPICHASM